MNKLRETLSQLAVGLGLAFATVLPMPVDAAESVQLPIPAPRAEQNMPEEAAADPLGALLERVVASAPPQQAAMPVVIALRLREEEERARVVIELSDPVDYQIFTLTDPNRIVVDMPEVLWGGADNTPPTGNGIVQSYRYGLFREGNSRFVIDLNSPVAIASQQMLPPENGFGFRLLLDLHPTNAETFASDAGWPQAFRGEAGFGRPPAGLGVAQASNGASPGTSGATGKRVIVVDAGHGGIDPGTHGASGLLEKDVVLAVAMKLRHALESTGKYVVHLTREGDFFIPLRGRVEIARAAGADLFLSLHIDSHDSPTIRGASVYTLSEDASDREAARLAEKENMSDVIAGIDLAGEDNPVASILIDLAQRDTMNRSVRFAETVLANLSQATFIRPTTPRRSAGFAVLKAPDVPAVLIELGYITNQSDESAMASEAWRSQIAASITSAIDRHFGLETSGETQQAAIP